MRHFIIFIISILSFCSATAITFNDEKLHYKVMYKWGFVNKQAGTATLSIRNQDSQYITRLVAKSEPWADKFYMVRDTLNGVIQKNGFLPLYYEKKAHEGNTFKHDIVKYSRSGNIVYGECTRIKRDKDEKDGYKKEQRLSATGTTVDILSVFYYMRAIDYNKMKPGQVLKMSIFSGKRKELLTIKYMGTENVAYDNKNYNCFHINFTFTSTEGGKKTSEDMDAWLSTEINRTPIKLEGTLTIGKVQCFYTGKG